jgi:DNA uptake protein ComE-like DNA-binding protein
MDINKASAEELQRTFEVDGERASYIINKRNQLGGFQGWDQIKALVPSIDDKMVENLRAAGLTVGSRAERDSNKEERTAATASRSVEGSSSSDGSSKKDINGVTGEQLEQICQIDGERADYFLRARRELGGFDSWEQIEEKVPSFDTGMVKRLKNAGYGFGSKAA